MSNHHEIVDEIASKNTQKNRVTVQRSRFLLTIKEDLTRELRNCLHLVSVHDVWLKLTLDKVSRGFDAFNTVYFLDPETDMDFDRSLAFY